MNDNGYLYNISPVITNHMLLIFQLDKERERLTAMMQHLHMKPGHVPATSPVSTASSLSDTLPTNKPEQVSPIRYLPINKNEWVICTLPTNKPEQLSHMYATYQ